MLEDQRRLRASNVRVGVEVLHDERAQILRIAGGDVQDKVVGAGEEVHVDHLGQLADLANEMADSPASVRLQTDRDHRLQRPPDRRWVDIGVEPADHSKVLQSAHSTMACRRRDTDDLRERTVGYPGIVMQYVEDAAVYVVDGGGLNILRRLVPLDTCTRRSFWHELT